MVNSLLKNGCLIVGHYTSPGKEIKKQIFPKDYDGLEMSWFIIDGFAYGGRAGLFRLIQYVMFGHKKRTIAKNEFNLSDCDTDCKTRKGTFLRIWNIVIKYKKIQIYYSTK
jgi:hypothetical protein